MNRVSLFTRRANGGRKLRKRLESDMTKVGDVAERYAGRAVDGSLDLLPFATRAFELAPTRDIEYLVTHGCDGSEFFLRELKPNWRGLTREQRAAKIASFVRFANLLERSDDTGTADAGAGNDAAAEHLAELRATVRTKIVLLASAYDAEYDDSYCRRIARNPQRFGDYELTGTGAHV
jgi:hypothetical protein